ncbi:hypothetical protein [Oceanobacter mangrovi]|uniref:hypothetical protein n=1 Tax=Oceanobacter mangrovi TaxID=2862510 RepID=UPI001C8EBC18|nr:hypothetical protein [Oceanobacter mangrovi]
MEDLVGEGIFRFLLHVLVWTARILYFLAWELMIERIGWSIGWVICRLLSWGKYPEVGLGEYDHASGPTSVLVNLIGILVLASIIGAGYSLLGEPSPMP